MFKLTSTHLALTLILVNVTLSQAMLPPPMLRAVCSAFADAEEAFGNSAMAAGKKAAEIVMKPIAIVGGLKTAAVGTGMKISGEAMNIVGNTLSKKGALIGATGSGLKGAGLGVAALGLKPLAEKVVTASEGAEGHINKLKGMASKIGDTSIQIDATIDSPLLGHHHKNVAVTSGLDTAMNNDVLQNAISQEQIAQSQEVDVKTIGKRAAKLDPELIKSVLNLVKEAKMEDCVALAVCDLNCNPQGFGQDGKQVFMNMVRLQGANLLDRNESKYFYEAASKGRSCSGKCEKCSEFYMDCKSKSSDLIRMASHIKLD